MKKTVIILALLLVAAAAEAQLLWRVSAPGSTKVSYIVGTHHVAPTGMIDSIAGLKQAITSVDKVYGELNMTETSTPAAQQKMMSVMMAPADSTLTAVLTPAQADSVDVWIKKYLNGMASLAQLNVMKPSAVTTQIAMVQTMQAFPGFNPADQLDTRIQKEAAASGKTVGGLETLDFQMNMLFGSPISDQAKGLMKAVRLDELVIDSARKLAAAYLGGNLDSIMALSIDPVVGMTEEDAEELIYSRNAAWAERLSKEIPGESVLVAVGAAHLPGEKGLLELLRKSGLNVEPAK